MTDPKTGGPAANGERTVWINETALPTALNTCSVSRYAKCSMRRAAYQSGQGSSGDSAA